MPLKSSVLSKYPNEIFVETGTWKGDAVALALELGFDRIYSIEQDCERADKAIIRFTNNNNVFIYHGGSEILLPAIMSCINKQVTFWLDAHAGGSPTRQGISQCPLLDELRIIAGHRIKTHTILIDDMKYFRKPNGWLGVTQHQIEEALLAINRKYRFSYEPGKRDEHDILVASL